MNPLREDYRFQKSWIFLLNVHQYIFIQSFKNRRESQNFILKNHLQWKLIVYCNPVWEQGSLIAGILLYWIGPKRNEWGSLRSGPWWPSCTSLPYHWRGMGVKEWSFRIKHIPNSKHQIYDHKVCLSRLQDFKDYY